MILISECYEQNIHINIYILDNDSSDLLIILIYKVQRLDVGRLFHVISMSFRLYVKIKRMYNQTEEKGKQVVEQITKKS